MKWLQGSLALVSLLHQAYASGPAFADSRPSASNKHLQCHLKPLGKGKDDTSQIEAAITKCGHGGITTFAEGEYNITRKMTWHLKNSEVHLNGYLSFIPDIQYWLDAANTYRVVFIQNQASWFVLTGSDFLVDAHNTGGINGNGQPWWSYYANRTREDGDGRPIALTLSNVTRGVVKDFRIEAQPFWCNTVAQSTQVVYDGMYCNATNTDPAWVGKNIVPNTDGIDTYRSDSVVLKNWDITCGDDCLAIKGNSTNLFIDGVTCRGGNGIAIGSLGQYVDLPDIVENVTMQNLHLIRLNSSIQPNMQNGVYLKSWDGTVNGVPPTGGGGATGHVKNVVVKHAKLDRVNKPVALYQTNGAHSGDAPSTLQFSNVAFEDFTGTAATAKREFVDIECSPAVPCPNIKFADFDVSPPAGASVELICKNVVNYTGLSGGSLS
ncbi:hypothetical protein PUNSTDRAFT_154787 [Punctularia strigosozonata HHB-11173 SS5]|uniref:uncharacterized protein n=1 Tax=Punctularia strigosozonata (strain HHB-11173) TaxID=741275 RepID=UPI00044183B2|nr:uncharacterized protein PUNSTDRAFT_154787 [Punctularia strigosozonata HHB-11173 SS5]EIN14755.1 hypothetical protein PUNSTDRAFT_154787 [Punctularia strigosozonata HHB-11173 SS5]